MKPADNGIACSCGTVDLRVVRTTRVRGGIRREKRCSAGHRIFTIEKLEAARKFIPRMSPLLKRGSCAVLRGEFARGSKD